MSGTVFRQREGLQCTIKRVARDRHTVPRIHSALSPPNVRPQYTIIKEYTTPTLSTMVAAGKDMDILVFNCPWIQNRTGTKTTHCLNGMFLQVSVQGCKTEKSTTASVAPATASVTSATVSPKMTSGSVEANSVSLLVVFAALVRNQSHFFLKNIFCPPSFAHLGANSNFLT